MPIDDDILNTARAIAIGRAKSVTPERDEMQAAQRTAHASGRIGDIAAGMARAEDVAPNDSDVKALRQLVDSTLPANREAPPTMAGGGIPAALAVNTAQNVRNMYARILGKDPDSVGAPKTLGEAAGQIANLGMGAVNYGIRRGPAGVMTDAIMSPLNQGVAPEGRAQLEKGWQKTFTKPSERNPYDLSVPTEQLDWAAGAPAGALNGAVAALQKGESPLSGATAGAFPTYHEQRPMGSDILGNAGVTNPWLKYGGGFVWDMITDPLNALTFGASGGVEQAAKQAGRAVERGAQSAGVVDRAVIDGLKDSGMLAVKNAYGTSKSNELAGKAVGGFDKAMGGALTSMADKQVAAELARQSSEAFKASTGAKAIQGGMEAPSLGRTGITAKLPIPMLDVSKELVPREAYAKPIRAAGEYLGGKASDAGKLVQEALELKNNPVDRVAGFVNKAKGDFSNAARFGSIANADLNEAKNNISVARDRDIAQGADFRTGDPQRDLEIIRALEDAHGKDAAERRAALQLPDAPLKAQNEELANRLIDRVEQMHGTEKAIGLNYDRLDNYVPHQFKQAADQISGATKRGLPGFTKERTDLASLNDIHMVGKPIETDLGKIYATRKFASDRLVAEELFFQKMQNKFGISRDINNGHIEIPKDKLEELQSRMNAPGAMGVQARKDSTQLQNIVDEMNNMRAIKKEDPAILRGTDAFTKWFKTMSTQPSLSYHAGNAMGDFYNMYRAGMNPKQLAPAWDATKIVKSLRTGEELTPELAKIASRKVGDRTLGDALQAGINRGLLSSEFGAGDIGDAVEKASRDRIPLQGMAKKKDLISQVLPGENNKIVQMGVKGGEKLENHRRIALYLDGLSQGLSPDLAVERTKKYLYDFKDLTDVESKGMKRVVPFYSYMRKNIPGQIEGAIENPAKAIGTNNARKEWNAFADSQVPDENHSNEPRYQKQVMGWHTPMKDDKGRQINLAPRIGIADLNKVPNPLSGLDMLDDTFAQTVPPIKLSYELGANRNTLTHRELGKTRMSQEPTKDMASYVLAKILGDGGPGGMAGLGIADTNDLKTGENTGPKINVGLQRAIEGSTPGVARMYDSGLMGLLGLSMESGVPGLGAYKFDGPAEDDRTTNRLADQTDALMAKLHDQEKVNASKAPHKQPKRKK